MLAWRDVHNVMLWMDRSAYGITASCCHILFLCNDRCSSATLAFVMYDLCVGRFCKYLFFDIHSQIRLVFNVL